MITLLRRSLLIRNLLLDDLEIDALFCFGMCLFVIDYLLSWVLLIIGPYFFRIITKFEGGCFLIVFKAAYIIWIINSSSVFDWLYFFQMVFFTEAIHARTMFYWQKVK
jgi:hypothetical protein